MRRFVLGAVSAALVLGVAASAEARRASNQRQPFQLTSRFLLTAPVPSPASPSPSRVLASTLQESLAARAPAGPALAREKRVDLRGGQGMRQSLALFVDRRHEAPRQTRLRWALPGKGPARPTFFSSSAFDPWRGPAMEPGPGVTARILASERRFEERQGRFATATTGRAGFAVEIGGR